MAIRYKNGVIARDLPRGFGRSLGPRQRVNLNNTRRAARSLLADAAACSPHVIGGAERLLATKPATLARACGLTTQALQAMLDDTRKLYNRREHERTPQADAEALQRRIAVLTALSVAKEIMHNAEGG